MEPDSNEAVFEPDSSQPIELAHVLFTDLVGYSMLPMEEQNQYLREFQSLVRGTAHFRGAEKNGQLISLPTGDGMALVFFGDPIAPVQCSLEIAAALAGRPHLRLRMGLNTGPVYRVSDVNSNQNVSGAGINMAQRIMDAGDAGHILMSKSAADVLASLRQWAPLVHDLGQHAVKHGVFLHFYNLYTEQLGNPELPSKMRKPAPVQKRRWLRTAGIALGVIAVLTAGARYFLVPAEGARRKSVAILGFRNITGRPGTDWVATAMTEGLRAELAGADRVRTISDEEVTEMKRSLASPALSSLGKASLAKLKGLGADIVILGSFSDSGKDAGARIHLDLQIQDTGAGETIGSVTGDTTELEIGKLVAETGKKLWDKLHLGAVPAQKERELDAARPNGEAAPLYAEGLTRLRQYDAAGAKDYFEKAIGADANFPFAHAMLAECWSILGFDTRAEAEAKRAFELSAKLPLEDRLSVEGRYREMAHDWDKAIASYSELFQHYPDNVDYGLKLAAAQRSAGKGKQALVTLAALRQLPGPEGRDPRIDLEDAECSAAVGDNTRAQASAAAAVQKAGERGSPLLKARALNWTCTSLRHLGQFDKAKAACENAVQVNSAAGDRLGMARAINGLGNVLNAQGDLQAARSKFERALEITSEIGAKRDMTGALGNLAMVLSAEGNLAGAEQRYRQTLEVQKEIGFRNEIPRTLNNLGDVLHSQGNLAESQSVLESASNLARETGNAELLALSLVNLGAVLFDRGDLPQAERAYTEVLAIQSNVDDKDLVASASASLGKLSLARGKLDDAQKHCEQARKLQQDAGDKQGAATTAITLARILMEQKQFVAAERMLRDVITDLGSGKHSPDEILARVLLARAVLAQNRSAEAGILMVSASGLVDTIAPATSQYGPKIAAARISAALNPSAGAQSISTLREMAASTSKAGMPELNLEARLGIGRIELSGGQTALARRDLKVVQDEAMRKGFLLLAREAAPR